MREETCLNFIMPPNATPYCGFASLIALLPLPLNDRDNGKDCEQQDCKCGQAKCKHRTHKHDQSEVVNEHHNCSSSQTEAERSTLNLLVIHEEEDKDQQSQHYQDAVHHEANLLPLAKSYYTKAHSE